MSKITYFATHSMEYQICINIKNSLFKKIRAQNLICPYFHSRLGCLIIALIVKL